MQRIYLGFDLFYDVFENKKRTIYAPSKTLKDFQRQILNFIKTKYKIKFEVKKCAEVHCNKDWVLRLDILKFYESVTKTQIKSAINDIFKVVEFPKGVTKDHVYQLCTLEDKLPTGAVTSCHIANIVFEKTKIDEKLMKFCAENGIKYSRYMDDMFFSGETKIVLKKAEKYAITLLNENGFNVNHEQTKYISGNKRQEILGLIVNNEEAPAIAQNTKHNYRSLFFNYLKSIYLEERLGINTLFLKKIGFKEVTGHLAYIKNTDPKFYETMKKYIKSSIRKFGIYNNDEIKKLRKIIK